MKKSIFILAALFAATFSKAELTPDYTLPLDGPSDSFRYINAASTLFSPSPGQSQYDVMKDFIHTLPSCPFFVRVNATQTGEGSTYTFLNPFNYSEYKTFDATQLFKENEYIIAAVYDVFVVDKLAFVWVIKTTDSGSAMVYEITDEDGNIILQRQDDKEEEYTRIERFGSVWKLVRLISNSAQTGYINEIYTFPGDGSMPNDAQAISNPSPKKNARKVAREGQVLVETENSTYTLQGQEVK